MKIEVRGGEFRPYFNKYELKPKKGEKEDYIGYWGRKQKDCRDNIGSFYAHLASSFVGGTVLKDGQPHGHDLPMIEAPKWNGFKPDVLIKKGDWHSEMEVKSGNTRGGGSLMAHKQFANYLRHFLMDHNSEVYIALFKYGNREVQKLHTLTEGELIKKLAKSTRSLLVVPHNLLSFLALMAPTSEKDHGSSSGRDVEQYFRLLGTHISLLVHGWQNPRETFDNIIDERRQNIKRLGMNNPLYGFKLQDFCLENLVAERIDSPESFCKGYYYSTDEEDKKVNLKKIDIKGYKSEHFPVIIYSSPDNKGWKEFLSKNLKEFLDCLGITKAWNRQQELMSASTSQEIPF